jgi:hypothetical protein
MMRNRVNREIISIHVVHHLQGQSMGAWTRVSFLLFSSLFAFGQSGPAPSVASSANPTNPPTIIIGFMGGFVRHDDLVHSGVQLAARLRKDYPTDVHVEVFENRRREKAHEQILKLLDTNHDATLSFEEKQVARIIIYGMSWGGSETVTLARELEEDGIPVLLTIQVDSVAKIRQNDAVIPGNVSEAVNFYQPNGTLHGQPKIRAADEERTKILGNFRFEYESKPIRCEKYPWYDRVFAKSHTEIECDPVVWNQVESLIRSKLPPVKPDGSRSGTIQ